MNTGLEVGGAAAAGAAGATGTAAAEAAAIAQIEGAIVRVGATATTVSELATVGEVATTGLVTVLRVAGRVIASPITVIASIFIPTEELENEDEWLKQRNEELKRQQEEQAKMEGQAQGEEGKKTEACQSCEAAASGGGGDGGDGDGGDDDDPKKIKEKAQELKKRNGDKNRVETPEKRIDLDGEGHYDPKTGVKVETPHVHDAKPPHPPNSPGAGRHPGYESVPRPATMKDLKDAEAALKGQGK